MLWLEIPAYAGSTISWSSQPPRRRIIPAGVHRHIDAFIDVGKHFSLPWRDFHGKVGRYGGA